jgi:hypothetical protein
MAAKTTNLLTSEDGKLAKVSRLCRFSRLPPVRRMVVTVAFGKDFWSHAMTAEQRRATLEAMIADEPTDPELRYSLAMEFASAGDDAEAVRRFEELIRVVPNYPPAYHMAARALQRLNRVVEAKALLVEGIPVAQKKGDSHAAGEMTELLESLDLS